jgi:hypothetical protein
VHTGDVSAAQSAHCVRARAGRVITRAAVPPACQRVNRVGGAAVMHPAGHLADIACCRRAVGERLLGRPVLAAPGAPAGLARTWCNRYRDEIVVPAGRNQR